MDLTVTSNNRMDGNYILMKLTGGTTPLPTMKPGQFAELKIEGSPSTYLRRPISINYVDHEHNELWLLIQMVGDGTRKLGELKKGDSLNMVLPLGNGFGMPDDNDKQKKLLLVGGGVGLAPMLMLGAELKNAGYSPIYLIGARNKAALLEMDEFKKIGAVYTTTEDGSDGEKGFVTNHSLLQKEKFDKIYVCGPTPMMKAVASYAKQSGTECEVSLENKMACGLGACLCCVTETKEGNKCVCSEGPVFNINELTWQI